jgi:hypothetical protein
MKPHRFDAISFFSGLVTALLGLLFLIPQTPVDIVETITSIGSWFWPTLLVLLGIGIMVPVLTPKRED